MITTTLLSQFHPRLNWLLQYYRIPLQVLFCLIWVYFWDYFLIILGLNISILCLIQNKKDFKTVLLLCLIGLCFASVYDIQHAAREKHIREFINTSPKIVTGTVVSGAKEGYLYLENKSGYVLTVKLKENPYKPGDVLEVQGRYIPPRKPRNPGQFDAFSYAVTQKRLGLFIARSIQKTGQEKGYFLQRLAYSCKQFIVTQHRKHLPEGYSDLYSALIFGEMLTAIPKDFKDSFISSGLLHALVVSGSQVSLIMSVLHRLLLLLTIYRGYQLLILIPIAIFFYLLTGGGPSIMRSLLMTGIMIAFKYLLGHKTSALHILSATAAIMMLINPFVVTNLGAILSFTVTSSLLFSFDFFREKLPKRLPKVLKQALCMGLVPWIWSFPILACSLHYVSLSSIVLNACLGILIEYSVIIGFFSTLIGVMIPFISLLMDQLALALLMVIVQSSLWVSSNWTSLIHLPSLNSTWTLILIALTALTLMAIFFKNKRLQIITFALFLYLCASISTLFQEKVIITFLDVGQGDCALIEYKHYTLLVDTGAAYSRQFGSITNAVILPALRSKGIHHLDYLIITHFDKDHVGSFFDISKHIKIGTFIHNGNLSKHPKIADYLNSKQIKSLAITGSQVLSLSKLKLEFFGMNRQLFKDKNNQSLVFNLNFKEIEILFTGDIEKEAERHLVSNYKEKLDSDILKVGHHGSKTSSTPLFLSYVTPKHSIISAGLQNRYRHPHKQVTQRLNQYGPIWKTKERGAIEIQIHRKLRISGFLDL